LKHLSLQINQTEDIPDTKQERKLSQHSVQRIQENKEIRIQVVLPCEVNGIVQMGMEFKKESMTYENARSMMDVSSGEWNRNERQDSNRNETMGRLTRMKVFDMT
jgi:hypothetical protein